ncbi:heparan-alpha-glucosaminide N-acetyltransferase domain-containing protein [Antarcticibacterium sp. 1MA-6-2]|uniref:acyltransferase family protein n=1 Tax=Antarcticibacterium sp. 1MA-6-2 TaxID=2908210 RepID=UPI001F319789|nr:heparan-alpha-glucosaminide N-acetyltransferase domain-containing protein [Antarcticibacterium sp. 1MA-6-2]UJH92312.1 heparan-alpha-glucosaminide N-acetyltransferase domain-containing protein [Antarcticibacterium sp. 1MA-6-2]
MARIKERYLSLDILRGLTIALMIIVNTPGSWGSIYAPFRHAAWHGFTITDLVFPSFLFVIGNAMSFSLRKYEAKGEASFLRKLFTRALIIFLIGLFLNGFPFIYHEAQEGWQLINFADIRIMGVLQRIALCYLIAGLLIRYLAVKPLVLVGALLLGAYWGLMYYFGDTGDPYSLEGNAALKFDLLLLDPKNLYQGYGIPFDPEGFLSTLPAIVNVIGGYVAGIFIQKSGNNFKTVWKLALAGILLLGVALMWDFVFPINKPIWTSSYVLYTIGWDIIGLGALIFITEIINFKKGAYFFEVFGRNPLFIYILSGIIIEIIGLIQIGGESLKSIIYENLFLSWLSALNASLLFAICYTLVLWLIALWMDRRSIYIKV